MSILTVCVNDLEAAGGKIPLVAIISPKNDRECRFTARAVKRQMRELGYKKHKTIRYRTRRCDVTPSAVKKHVRRAIGKGAKVIVSFTGPVTRYVIDEARGSIPVLFCMQKTEALSLVNEEDIPLTGVFIRRASPREMLYFIRFFVPHLTTLGVLHASGDGAYDMNLLSDSAESMGITIKDMGTDEKGSKGGGDEPEKVDAVLVTVTASDKELLKENAMACLASGIPVFSGEMVSSGNGVLSCITMAPGEAEGRQLGLILDRLLKGEPCNNIARVETNGKLHLTIDLSVAERLGMKFKIPSSSLEMEE